MEPKQTAGPLPESARMASGMVDTLAGPLDSPRSLCLAIGVWPEGIGGRVIDMLENGCPGADRERLRLGFPMEVRAWELWRVRDPRPTPDELRALLAAAGCWHP